jgi:nucleotide-binding universal stress UspA family protein
MDKNILIPIAPDHEGTLLESVAVARALADEDAKLTVLSVVEMAASYVMAEVPLTAFDNSRDEVEAQMKEVLHEDSHIDLKVLLGHPPMIINDTAQEDGCDLIVIRSHKPGLADWFLGSTASRVVRHAGCSVHVIR